MLLIRRAYPKGLTDKKAYSSYSAELNGHFISPCGICIKVCPVGEDKILLEEMMIQYTDKDRFADYHSGNI